MIEQQIQMYALVEEWKYEVLEDGNIIHGEAL